MRQMMRGHGWHLLLVLATTILVMSASLCLFDSDEHDGAGIDLCLSLLLATSVPPLPVFLVSERRLAPVRVAHHGLTALEPTAPPPKA